ncbi:MAG: TylF/MycF/NovP-related O-methyltransferase, partial [Nodosilinea sp.]
MLKHSAKVLLTRLGYRVSKLEGSAKKSKTSFPKDFKLDSINIIERVRPFTMTSPERINGLIEAVDYVTANNLPGAIVECGVWKGGSMMAVAYRLRKVANLHRELYLFDTYEG